MKEPSYIKVSQIEKFKYVKSFIKAMDILEGIFIIAEEFGKLQKSVSELGILRTPEHAMKRLPSITKEFKLAEGSEKYFLRTAKIVKEGRRILKAMVEKGEDPWIRKKELREFQETIYIMGIRELPERVSTAKEYRKRHEEILRTRFGKQEYDEWIRGQIGIQAPVYITHISRSIGIDLLKLFREHIKSSGFMRHFLGMLEFVEAHELQHPEAKLIYEPGAEKTTKLISGEWLDDPRVKTVMREYFLEEMDEELLEIFTEVDEDIGNLLLKRRLIEKEIAEIELLISEYSKIYYGTKDDEEERSSWTMLNYYIKVRDLLYNELSVTAELVEEMIRSFKKEMSEVLGEHEV